MREEIKPRSRESRTCRYSGSAPAPPLPFSRYTARDAEKEVWDALVAFGREGDTQTETQIECRREKVFLKV